MVTLHWLTACRFQQQCPVHSSPSTNNKNYDYWHHYQQHQPVPSPTTGGRQSNHSPRCPFITSPSPSTSPHHSLTTPSTLTPTHNTTHNCPSALYFIKPSLPHTRHQSYISQLCPSTNAYCPCTHSVISRCTNSCPRDGACF